MNTAKFTINFNQDEKYYFNLLDENLQILIQSDLYETYDECDYAINLVKKFAIISSSYFKKVRNSNEYLFIFITPLGELIASSMLYVNTEALDKIIKKVMELSATAIIYENFD